jgi:hypothetical protein
MWEQYATTWVQMRGEGGRAMAARSAEPDRPAPPKIDATVPHQARVWNYLLGGIDNYAVDRAAGDAMLAAAPQVGAMARASRKFLTRAVRYLVGVGVRQFLDIGTGLPTAENTHEIAQAAAPESRIVYVDFDPLVLAYARALLDSTTPKGVVAYIDADLRDTGKVLDEADRTLDLTRPVGLILLGILGAIENYDEAHGIVGALLGALLAGSYLLAGDGTNTSAAMVEAARIRRSQKVQPPYVLRSPQQIAGFFAGLELVEPGVVPFTFWRPDQPEPPAHVDGSGGLGYIPGTPAVR